MASLAQLAIKHNTNKHGPLPDDAENPGFVGKHWRDGHRYANHYDHHFGPFRHREHLNVLEIGVGGYEDPQKGGESLRMWKEYFTHAQIVSLDYFDKTAIQEDRIRIYHGSQDDAELLHRMHDECGGFDIIIDDGSHVNKHVIASFKILFPLLRMGGIYVIEDLFTSYWTKVMGGSSTDLSSLNTSMGFLKSLVDGLNHVEYELPGYTPTYFDEHIVSMHFYHNLAFVYKGNNDEKSMVMENNQLPEFIGATPTPEWALASTANLDDHEE